jgi:CHASE3 domain sensor protein
MERGSILLFVGIIVGACIAGGAIYAGLEKIADAIEKSNPS